MTYEEAKKEAIERLKAYHAVFCANDDPNYGNEIIEALEQPAQEPVGAVQEGIVSWYRATPKNGTLLYTHLHQWQGLTDDEIIDLIIGKGWIDRLNDTYDLDHAKQEAIAMFGAIQQALKDKNT